MSRLLSRLSDAELGVVYLALSAQLHRGRDAWRANDGVDLSALLTLGRSAEHELRVRGRTPPRPPAPGRWPRFSEFGGAADDGSVDDAENAGEDDADDPQ